MYFTVFSFCLPYTSLAVPDKLKDIAQSVLQILGPNPSHTTWTSALLLSGMNTNALVPLFPWSGKQEQGKSDTSNYFVSLIPQNSWHSRSRKGSTSGSITYMQLLYHRTEVEEFAEEHIHFELK